ncbi:MULTISPECIES: site-specific DNA-methyltransferase [Azospirillum]|nr:MULTISPECIES: site-specific DNA-methyltransferase [Azospirillum]MDW5537593.1 site-specific DNA-methyltransferase [Azospirillum sp. NL1]
MSDALKTLILELVPSNGERMGNQALFTALRQRLAHVSEDEYQAVREELVQEGLLAKGRGRGGSVYRLNGHMTAASTSAETSHNPKPKSAPTMPSGNGAAAYAHADQAVLRPDAGVEAQFSHRKPPRTYRYDSSLAPELSWDENAGRAFTEWLLNLVAEAAEKGEAAVFAEPQVWKGTEERFTSLSQCAARLRSLTQPFLNWAGKAERQQISVPTLPLFVHERHSTQAILETLKSHKARGQTLDMFGDLDLDIADRLDAYKYKGPWTNRLILGDSLQVMNSLLEYEGLGSQVQMIYFDPPYGVKFGSNFQPFVRDRKVTENHGKDEYMIREPEMVKAYRDTWELGLHSYLSYIRDRLFVSKNLLSESGSIFVQISDDNIHHVRELMDEVFGENNFCAIISFRKTSGFSSNLISKVSDYLLWYAKDKSQVAYNPIYLQKAAGEEGATQYSYVESEDGTVLRSMTSEEKADPSLIPEGYKILTHGDLAAQGASGNTEPFEWNGREFKVPANSHWKTTPEGMRRLAAANRIMALGNTLRYKRYLADFNYFPVSNVWTDTGTSGFAGKKLYVVQTNPPVVERCIQMTTDPGDLVLDITCGSGTTAVASELWGRRWIAVDTSRIPVALARQRLLTMAYPWFRLKDPKNGPSGGFVYERKKNRKGEEVGGLIPKITLKSIANNEDPSTVTLVDRPEVNKAITRVCGTFTVEATIQAAMSMESAAEGGSAQLQISSPRAYLDRMIEVLRQSKSLNLPGNMTLQLDNVRPLADREYLHAEAVAKDGNEKTIAIAFGPEDGAISENFVRDAHEEAGNSNFRSLFIFGFAIQANAHALCPKLRRPETHYISVTPDVVMSDLLKTTKSSEIFSITGLPDVRLEKVGAKDDGTLLYRVVLRGLDIFRPDTMKTDAIEAENLPCWMLDTNHNGLAFYASQVFFPKTSAWDNLQKSLAGQFENSVWGHLAGTISEPFALGDKKRIAVKVIDERGNELMATRAQEDAV